MYYHTRLGRPLLACYPRDLVNQIADYAAYLGREPALNADTLGWAWHNYFASNVAGETRPAHPPHTLETTS